MCQTTSGEVRARLGEVAHQRSEFVIVTNSSPRLEDPGDIVQVRGTASTAHVSMVISQCSLDQVCSSSGRAFALLLGR